MKVKTTKTKRPPHKPNCAECSITYDESELKEICDECWGRYYKEIYQNEEEK